MVHRLEIAPREGLRDARGAAVAAAARDILGMAAGRVRSRDVYRIDAAISSEEAARVLHEFVDPVAQRGALGRLDDGPFDAAVTIAYKPGVTDPIKDPSQIPGNPNPGPLPRATPQPRPPAQESSGAGEKNKKTKKAKKQKSEKTNPSKQ